MIEDSSKIKDFYMNTVPIKSNSFFSWKLIIELKSYHTIEIKTEDGKTYILDKDKVIKFLKNNKLIKIENDLPRDAKGRFIKRS